MALLHPLSCPEEPLLPRLEDASIGSSAMPHDVDSVVCFLGASR
jgi:hypothetical protein